MLVCWHVAFRLVKVQLRKRARDRGDEILTVGYIHTYIRVNANEREGREEQAVDEYDSE